MPKHFVYRYFMRKYAYHLARPSRVHFADPYREARFQTQWMCMGYLAWLVPVTALAMRAVDSGGVIRADDLDRFVEWSLVVVLIGGSAILARAWIPDRATAAAEVHRFGSPRDRILAGAVFYGAMVGLVVLCAVSYWLLWA